MNRHRLGLFSSEIIVYRHKHIPEKNISFMLCLGGQAGLPHALRANLVKLSLKNENSGAKRKLTA